MGLGESIAKFAKEIISYPLKLRTEFAGFLIDVADKLVGGASPSLVALGESYGKLYTSTYPNRMEAMGRPISDAIIEAVKQWAYSIISNIERISDGTERTADDARRAFLDTIIRIQCDAWGWGVAGEELGLGAMETPAKVLDILYWGLGLGWQQWIVMSPLLRRAIADPLDRLYAAKYRNEIPTVAQLGELYVKRLIDERTYYDAMAKHGFSDILIKGLGESSYRDLTASQILKAHRLAPERVPDLDGRLKSLGYRDYDVQLLKLIYEREAEEATRELTASQALRAFNKGLRSESWVRGYLGKMGFTDEAIDVLVDLYKSEELDEERGLLKSDIRAALREGVISEADARKYLGMLNYSDPAINVMIAVWKHDGEMEKRQATEAVYETLFVNRVISETEFRGKLKELGYTDDAVTAYVERAKLRMVEAPKRLTPSQVLEAYQRKIRSEAWAVNYLRQLGYPSEDVDVLIELNRPK